MKPYSLVVGTICVAIATVAFLIVGAFSWLSVSLAGAFGLMAGGAALYLTAQPVTTSPDRHLLYDRERF